MAFVACIIWLALTIQAVFVLIHCFCAFIKWLFVPEAPHRDMVFHTGLWETAKRERLTRDEKYRRYLALFPAGEVPRSRWPTSFGR